MREGFMYDMGRIQRDIIPAWRERKTTERMPPLKEKVLTSEMAETFSESLVSSDLRQKLHEIASNLTNGSYLSRDIVGDPEKGTRHAHDFVTTKSDSGVQLFFIDPEHSMGKTQNHNPLNIPRRGDFRPQVNVTYAIELTPEGEVAKISLLRYRASAIPQDRPQLNKNSEQLQMARSALANGELPEMLQGHENEITFRLDFRPVDDGYKVSVQAREAANEDAVEKMIENMATGKALPSNDPLEGQLERFKSIMRTHFPKRLEEGKFKTLE